MAYWLFKSEPFKYPWSQLLKEKESGWDGVRNYQAANNMKAMKIGDKGFFYHSNEGLEIVGIVEISKSYHPDPTDESGRFGMVSVKPIGTPQNPVTLKQIKADPALAEMKLVKQSRLSVSPVTKEEWDHIVKMAGGIQKI